MQDEELQSQIVQWLEGRRELFLAAAKCVGLPAAIQIPRPVVTNIEETSCASSLESAQVASVAIPAWKSTLDEKVASYGTDIQNSPAGALYKAYGERCHAWTFFSAYDFRSMPREWIREVLLKRIESEYLEALTSLEIPNHSLAEFLARDVLCHIQSDKVDIVTALPLAGIRLAQDSIEINNVRLRKISARELGNPLDLSMHYPWLYVNHRGLRHSFPKISDERSVLEVRISNSKLVQPQGDLYPEKIVLALELLGFELHGEGNASTWTEPGPPLINGGTHFFLGRRGSSRDCTVDHLRRAEMLAGKMPDSAVGNPSSREEIVLHRFLLGNAEGNASDKLIDFAIAMEGFLLPPGKEGEYRFKFGLYGAWYLAANSTERGELFREFQNVYDMRSKIVHGSISGHTSSILEGAAKARELAARLLVKALEHGWPTHEALKHLALGCGGVSP